MQPDCQVHHSYLRTMKQHLRTLKAALRNHLVLHPTSFLRASIWLIGLSLLLYRTTTNFLELLYEYTDRNEAITIAVQSTSPIRPSNLTVCIPYYSGALRKLREQILSIHLNKSIIDNSNSNSEDLLEWNALRNRSWDVWSHPDFDRSSPQLVTFFLERIVRESNFDVLELNRSNFNWNQPILDAVWQFLSCWHNRDLTYLHPPDPEIFAKFKRSCRNVNLARIGPLSRRSIDLLVDASIRAFGVYAQVMVTFPSDKVVQFAITDRQGLTIGGDHLCVLLLSNSTDEVFVYRPPINDDPDLPPWKRYPRTEPFRIWPDDSSHFGAVPHVESLYATEFAAMPYLSAEFAYYSYGIDSIVRETRSEMTCNEDFRSSFAYCLATRQIDYVKMACGCVPFAYRRLDPSDEDNLLPYCDSEAYGNCSSNLLSTFDRYSNECTNRCKYVFYKWRHYIKTESISSDRRARFEASITPSNREPFVEFSLTTKYTWAQFMSQIGGVVNFYLGFSGLTIFGFLIVCIDVIGACIRLRMRRSGANLETRDEIQQSNSQSVSEWIEIRAKAILGDLPKETDNRLGTMENRIEAIDDKLEKLEGKLETKLESLEEKLEKLTEILNSMNK